MGENKQESRIIKTAYRRQNELFFGGLAVLFALVVIGGLLFSGIRAGTQKRRSGYLTGSWGKHEVNQELLDYLSEVPGVYAATPVLKMPVSLELGKYRWSGEVYGIDFAGADFNYEDTRRTETVRDAADIILGKNVLAGFRREDEVEIDTAERYLLEKQLLAELVKARLAGSEGQPAGGTETKAAGLTGSGGQSEPSEPPPVDAPEPGDTETGQREKSADEPGDGPAEEAAAVYSWQVEGIISDSHKELDEAIFIDRAALKELIWQGGVRAEVHNVLIKTEHIREIPTIITELERAGLSCTNEYQAELDRLSEQEKESRRYLYMTILVLIFAVYYIKSILSTPLQAPAGSELHSME